MSTPAHGVHSDPEYAPYGEVPGGTPDGAAFTGQNQDTVAGLHDFTFREYNPNQGRWMSPDPAGLAAVLLANPQSWNRYAYVSNNPLTMVDPAGLDGCYASDPIACILTWGDGGSGTGGIWFGGGPFSAGPFGGGGGPGSNLEHI